MSERPAFDSKDNRLRMPSPEGTEAFLNDLVGREIGILHKKGLVEGLAVKVNKNEIKYSLKTLGEKGEIVTSDKTDVVYSLEIVEKHTGSEDGVYFSTDPTHELHCNHYDQCPEKNHFVLVDLGEQNPLCSRRIMRGVRPYASKDRMKVEVPKYGNIDFLTAGIKPKGFFDNFVPEKG